MTDDKKPEGEVKKPAEAPKEDDYREANLDSDPASSFKIAQMNTEFTEMEESAEDDK